MLAMSASNESTPEPRPQAERRLPWNNQILSGTETAITLSDRLTVLTSTVPKVFFADG